MNKIILSNEAQQTEMKLSGAYPKKFEDCWTTQRKDQMLARVFPNAKVEEVLNS